MYSGNYEVTLTIPTITKSTREQQGMSMAEFGNALSQAVPGISISRAAVNLWELGKRRPEYTFVLLVLMKTNDWRAGWAKQVLHVLRPNLY